jgi:hypothetical protein
VKRAKLAADWAQQFENANALNAADAAYAAATAYNAAAYAAYDADAAYDAAAAAAYAARAVARAADVYAAAYATRRQFWADRTPSILALLDAMIAVTEEG